MTIDRDRLTAFIAGAVTGAGVALLLFALIVIFRATSLGLPDPVLHPQPAPTVTTPSVPPIAAAAPEPPLVAPAPSPGNVVVDQSLLLDPALEQQTQKIMEAEKARRDELARRVGAAPPSEDGQTATPMNGVGPGPRAPSDLPATSRDATGRVHTRIVPN